MEIVVDCESNDRTFSTFSQRIDTVNRSIIISIISSSIIIMFHCRMMNHFTVFSGSIKYSTAAVTTGTGTTTATTTLRRLPPPCGTCDKHLIRQQQYGTNPIQRNNLTVNTSISCTYHLRNLSYRRTRNAYYSSSSPSSLSKHNESETTTSTIQPTPNETEHSHSTKTHEDISNSETSDDQMDSSNFEFVNDRNIKNDNNDGSYAESVMSIGDAQGGEGEMVQTENTEDETIEIIIRVPDRITIPGTERGDKKLAIVYTCTVCNTRSMKQFTSRAYHHGVVIIKCPTCQQQHLIADRIGYFAEAHDPDSPDHGFDLSTVAKQHGHSYKRVTDTDPTKDDTKSGMNNEYTTAAADLTLEDWIGLDKMKELMQTIRRQQPPAPLVTTPEPEAVENERRSGDNDTNDDDVSPIQQTPDQDRNSK